MKASSPPGGDGQTWATAFAFLQDALTVARAPGSGVTEVWVATGVYNPDRDAAHTAGTGDRNATFSLINSVAVRGGFAGNEDPATFNLANRDFSAHAATLSGDLAGNDGGYFANNGENSYSVVTGGAGLSATAVLDGFTITAGNANLGGSPTAVGNCGGGIYCSSSSATFTNNNIRGNTTTGNGGGIFCNSSSPTITHNGIHANNALGGGGIYCSSSATITNNTLWDNAAALNGGGIYVGGSAPNIANNLLTGNKAIAGGGGIYCAGFSNAKITNDTIVGNSAGEGGGLRSSNAQIVTVSSTIVAFNSSGVSKTLGGSISFRNNCVFSNGGSSFSGVTDPTGTNGNISVDPKLASLTCLNTHLQPDSPCINAGDDSFVQAGWLDMDGQSRIQAAHVDMGADESDGTQWPTCSVPANVLLVTQDPPINAIWAPAYRFLQDALTAARVPGSGITEIWVASGVYKPDRDAAHPNGTGDRSASFQLINGVALRGGFSGTEDPATFDLPSRDLAAHETILTGDLAGDDSYFFVNNYENSYTVVTSGSGLTATAVIDGFTITGGNNDGGTQTGGGISCSSSSPTIKNNSITFNTAMSGGGIACLASASPTIANNTIIRNRCFGIGGGIFCTGSSSPVVTDNSISNNAVYCNVSAYGAGIGCWDSSSPTIANNTISGNGIIPEDISGYGSGGGIYSATGAPVITGNTIEGNSITTSYPGYPFSSIGGGIYVFGSATITNNLIRGNVVDGSGGGIACGSGVVAHNTISQNHAGSFAGGVDLGSGSLIDNLIVGNGGTGISSGSCVIADNTIAGNRTGISSSGSPTIVNNIVTFNSAGLKFSNGSTPVLRNNCSYANTAYDYSGVLNPTGTNGNISTDPHFVQTPTIGGDGVWGTGDDNLGDVHLLLGSPCIDAGNNADVPVGILTDLDGHPRFVDDPCTLDTGAGTAPIVDIGAYEYQPGPVCTPVSIVSWKSLRTHTGLGDLAIPLDPSRTGNGSAGPISEPRAGGPIHLHVEFDVDPAFVSPQSVQVQGQTTSNGILQGIVNYTAQVQMIGPTTLDIVLPADAPDQTCYRVDLSGAVPLLQGDTDCMLRALRGDTTGDGQVDMADALLTKASIGQPAGGFPRLDVTLSGGAVNLTDAIFAASLVTNPTRQALCP